MGGVCADVTSFVIRMDGQIEADEFVELSVVEAEHMGEVGSPIEVIIGGDELVLVIEMSIDVGGDLGKAGDQIEGIFESITPIFGLLHSFLIMLGEFGF